MDENTKKVLIEYVTEQKTSDYGNELIKNFCKQQNPQSLILYRGHKKSREIRGTNDWYSASKSKQVAIDEFSSKTCCIFTIHLIDVPIIDVNAFVGDEIGSYKDEVECIFLGGGTFYKDKNISQTGFLDNGNGEFECWYKLNSIIKDKKPFDVDEIINKIPEEEYDIIFDPSDVVGFDLTPEQKQMVYDKIKELQKQVGGKNKKINKKSKKRRKAKNKKTKRKKQRV